MIFVTVGHELLFDRLIEAMDIWAKENPHIEVFAQVAELGTDGFRPNSLEWKEFVSPDEFSALVEKANIIVAHAGMGSIITAQTEFKPIAILPRRAALMETRNDHQFATMNRFRDRAGIFPAEDETLVGHAIMQALESIESGTKCSVEKYAEPALVEALREFILSE